MNTQTILMCVVALILGMLLANMLKNVCGCKVVEGQGNSGGGSSPEVQLDLPTCLRVLKEPANDDIARRNTQYCLNMLEEPSSQQVISADDAVDICNGPNDSAIFLYRRGDQITRDRRVRNDIYRTYRVNFPEVRNLDGINISPVNLDCPHFFRDNDDNIRLVDDDVDPEPQGGDCYMAAPSDRCGVNLWPTLPPCGQGQPWREERPCQKNVTRLASGRGMVGR
tara:strand:+ start:130 stop:801 length:672 start_codon:yes stop_codon:yes gene_type:complete